MARNHHTVSLDLDFDDSLWAEAHTDNPMVPANDVVQINTTLKVDISVPPAVQVAEASPSPLEEDFAGEWAEMPEDMEALVEEALWQEPSASAPPSPPPETHRDDKEVSAPEPSDTEPAAAYGALSRRARKARTARPKRDKSERTALEISRAATWCALGLAASVVAGVVMPGPWAPPIVLAIVAVAFAVMQVGSALESADYKKVIKVANPHKLSVAVPPVLGVVLSQVIPAELVTTGGPIPSLILAAALGLFVFAWLAPTLQGLQVPTGLLVLVTASAFATAHIAAMLSARAALVGQSVVCSVLLGALFAGTYVIRPKPMEVMGGVAIMMALLVV